MFPFPFFPFFFCCFFILFLQRYAEEVEPLR